MHTGVDKRSFVQLHQLVHDNDKSMFSLMFGQLYQPFNLQLKYFKNNFQ